jgi:hypothetical protein
MIKDASNMTQDLVKLQKVRKDITQEKQRANAAETTNNSIFVGSTAELQKFLHNKNIKNITE